MRGHVLGVSAAAEQAKDALSRLPHPRRRAGFGDLAGKLDPGNLRGEARRRRIFALSLQQVGAVERRRAHPHQHLVGRDRRLADLADFQNFRPAESGNPNCLHGVHDFWQLAIQQISN
jgi:hypothetical protein